MIPDRHPFELELGFACGYGNQAQVSGTAAYVTHYNEAAGLQGGLPGIRVRGQPGVERGLGLFEQRDPREPGLFRRLHGQLPRHLVERGRHREDHLLCL